MAIAIWLMYAIAAATPLAVARVAGVRDAWNAASAMLLVLPFLAIVAAQGVAPVGGASSFLVRTAAAAGIAIVAQLALLAPPLRRASHWVRMIAVLAATAAAGCTQLVVPALTD